MSHSLKTVTYLSTKWYFYVVFSLEKFYIVRGLDCNKKLGTQVLLLMPF